MFRWPMLIIGIVMIILASMMKSDHKPLPGTAEVISVQQAILYAEGSEKKFVEINAQIDTSKVIYGTVVKKPFYTKRPTDRSYRMEDIKARDEYVGGYAGTVVTAGDVLSGNSILLQTISESRDDKRTDVLRERVLAHVTDRIWILSPMFRKGDTVGRDTWLNKNNYEGGLIYFRDLLTTVKDPEIENRMSDIINFAQTEFGIHIPEEAFVLIDGYGTGFTPKAYYPVKDSGNSIFLVADPKSHPEELKSVKGIFYPAPSSNYTDFPKLLGEPVGLRVATVVQEDPGAFNKRKEDDVKGTYIFGGTLLILSLLGFLRKRIKRAKQIIQNDKNAMRDQL